MRRNSGNADLGRALQEHLPDDLLYLGTADDIKQTEDCPRWDWSSD
jgi:hypothetical protein